METFEVLKSIRKNNNLTQDEMAERLHITRQAVSRWEDGTTEPNMESLKLISKEFNVSINTILGSPEKLICQCCGMELKEDEHISREKDKSFNEDYCKWCYGDEKFKYEDKLDLVEFLVNNIDFGDIPKDKLEKYLDEKLSNLKHWKGEN